MRSARLSLLLAVAPLAVVPVAAVAQYAAPTAAASDADALASEIRRLAANPQDLNALTHAGELALRLDDPTAAAGFFARAQKIDPRNARVEAGMGTLMVEEERPGEALRRFNTALSLGADPRSFAADRGLAYDLIGEQERAQRDYRLALHDTPNDETARRYALSLGISGKRDEAARVLEPLLRRSDRGAWRARAFILAMGNDRAGAERIATTMLPAGMADGLQPFFERLPSLSGADRAFAVHFGETRPTPERLVDARMVPPLPALGPDPYPPVALAEVRQTTTPVDSREERRRNRKRKGAIATATTPPPQPLPEPPAYAASGSSTMPGMTGETSRPSYATAMVQPLPSQARYPAMVQALPSQTRYPATVQPLPSRSPYPATVAPVSARSRYAATAGSLPPTAMVQALPPGVTVTKQTVPSTPTRTVSSTVATVLPPRNNAGSIASLPASNGVTARDLIQVRSAGAGASAPVTLASQTPPLAGTSTPLVVASNPVAAASPATTSPPASTGAAAVAPVSTTNIVTPSIPASPGATAVAITLAPQPTTPETAVSMAATTPVVETPAPAISQPAHVVARSITPPAHVAKPTPVRSEDSILASIIAGVRVPTAEAERAEPPAPALRVGRAASSITEKAAVAEVKTRGDAKTSDDKPIDPKKLAAEKKAAEARKLADAKKAADAKAAADEKKAARADPPRVWVQVAGGANEDTLPKAWAAVKGKAPDAFRGKSGWTTPLRATNRVLTGPFKSDDEARDFVNALAKAGVSAFTFNSEAGQKVTRLPTK